MLTNRHIFQVEQDFNHILLQTFERGVLMQHAVDFNFDDGTARNRGKQHATQRIAQGMAETTLKRLYHDFGAIGSELFDAEAPRPQHTS